MHNEPQDEPSLRMNRTKARERQVECTLLLRPRELAPIWGWAQFFCQGILGAPLGKFVTALVGIAALANVSVATPAERFDVDRKLLQFLR
jgi:hypothetical protein